MGIDRFGACPSEDAYVFGNGPPELRRDMDWFMELKADVVEYATSR